MPSTYSARLRFTLQATGENLNTWGLLNNSGVVSLIDFAIAGATQFTLSGSKTLSTNNGSTDEARAAVLDITGGSGGTVTIPTVTKTYAVRNNAAGSVTFTTGGGATVVLPAGSSALIYCDASNVYNIRSSDFGGSRLVNIGTPVDPMDAATRKYVDDTAFNMAAGALPGQLGQAGKVLQTDSTVASWHALVVADVAGAAPSAAPNFTGGITIAGGALQDGSTKATPAALAANNFDLSAADFFTKSISANTTFTFSNPTAAKAQAFIVELTISSAAVPTWPASVTWGGGINPSALLGNGRHLIGFATMNGGTTWTGLVGAVAAA